MNKVPEYLKPIIEELHSSDQSQNERYTLKWLNEWLDIKGIKEKYGAEWEHVCTPIKNHNQAKGYLEAVGAIYTRSLKKLPEITVDEADRLSGEIVEEIERIVKTAIHYHPCLQHGKY